jgi:nucleoside-diphosphate-sugar epimerase
MNADIRKILVLGASGLIGRFVTDDLRGGDFPWWVSRANCPRRRKAMRSISNCLSCR